MSALSQLETEIIGATDRAIERLYSLNGRIEGAMGAVVDCAEQHDGFGAEARMAYGRAVQREAQAGILVLLEAMHTAGELVGLGYALKKVEQRQEIDEPGESAEASANG